MDDNDLLALCVLEEAGGEIDDGKAAIVRVVLNRMAVKFFSDGTIAGTVLKKDQFSWAWFAFTNGAYRRVAWVPAQARNIAQQKLTAANPDLLAHCGQIAQQVMAGTYSGTLYDQMTSDVVMYVNLAISQPDWAIPEKLVCVIGRHSFFRA